MGVRSGRAGRKCLCRKAWMRRSFKLARQRSLLGVMCVPANQRMLRVLSRQHTGRTTRVLMHFLQKCLGEDWGREDCHSSRGRMYYRRLLSWPCVCALVIRLC